MPLKYQERSLEPLQSELLSVLYPIFVHCYLRIISCDDDAAAAFLTRWADAHNQRFADEMEALRGELYVFPERVTRRVHA